MMTDDSTGLTTDEEDEDTIGLDVSRRETAEISRESGLALVKKPSPAILANSGTGVIAGGDDFCVCS